MCACVCVWVCVQTGTSGCLSSTFTWVCVHMRVHVLQRTNILFWGRVRGGSFGYESAGHRYVCAAHGFAFWFSCSNRQLFSQPCLGCLMKDPGRWLSRCVQTEQPPPHPPSHLPLSPPSASLHLPQSFFPIIHSRLIIWRRSKFSN